MNKELVSLEIFMNPAIKKVKIELADELTKLKQALTVIN